MARDTCWPSIYLHLLEALFVHLQHTHGPVATKTANPSANLGLGLGLGGSFLPTGTPVKGGFSLNAHANQPNGDNVSEEILNIFRKHGNSEVGMSLVSVHNVLAKSRPGVSLDSVMSVAQSLSEEGLLYTTCDEEHFKCTDMI